MGWRYRDGVLGASRRQDALSALAVFALIALIQIVSSGSLWPASLVANLIAAALLKSVLEGSLAAGPIGVHCGAGILLLLGPTFEFGILISFAMMLGLGEVLTAARFAAWSGPGDSQPSSRQIDPIPAMRTFALALVAGIVVAAAAIVPEAPALTVAAIGAALLVAALLYRSRRTADLQHDD